MGTNACPCGQPAPDAAICGACERDLTLALLAAIVIGPDLDLAIARQTRFGDPTGRGGVSVLPFDERASEAAWVLRNTLSGWVRVLAEMAPERAVSYAGARNGAPGYAGMPQGVSGLPGASESHA